MKSFKTVTLEAIKSTLFFFGLDVQRIQNSLSEKVVLRQFLKQNSVDIICDVGANVGQYHDIARKVGYRGEIISFEPLSQAYSELTGRVISDPDWIIAPRQALGAVDGEISINIAGNSASSSVLPMLERHRAVAPYSAYVSTELVKLSRLDTVAQSYLKGKSSGLLKIDTQGYEKEVIVGAQGVMHHFSAIQLELSLVPLYGGQATLVDICTQLANLGFQLRYIMPGLRDPKTYELLQIDGIFVRQEI